ncbi:MAG: hypothetical protein RL227_468 [Pseudomonadota bacterium]|jgi:beta-hydroxylase
MSMVPASGFRDESIYPFTAVLRRDWQRIREEFLAVQDSLTTYVEPQLFNQGWQVYGLWNLPHRESLYGQAERCPFTTALIEEHIPSHGAAAFSVLNPGTTIYPHEGHQGPYLRCHLGLEVPPGDCALQVGDASRRWTEGEVLVFDDRNTHAAWNRTQRRRVVLLVDFRE